MSPANHSHLATPGILFALTSALLFGASTPFAKLLLDALDPLMLAGLLYLGSGLGLWLPCGSVVMLWAARLPRHRCGSSIYPG